MSGRDPETALREPLPPEGVPVPLLASFLGVAGVPLLSLGRNSMSPLLRLYPDEIEFKVYRAHRRSYRRIRRVEVQTFIATRNIELVWHGSAISFTANVRDDGWRRAVLRLLEARNMPLTEAARALLPPSG